MTGNPMDLYEAAAFYRSAALSGESVTGHEYDEVFAYWDDTDFSNVNPDDHYVEIERDVWKSRTLDESAKVRALTAERDALARIVWQLKQKSSHV